MNNKAKVDNIKKAQKITDNTFSYILSEIKIGTTEKEIADKIKNYMFSHGAEDLSFDTIVVSGERTCLPHGEPSDKKIKSGEFLTIDMGAVVNGYCSDMTRTIAVGTIDEEKKKVYDTVLKAQKEAIKHLKSEITACSIDKIARNIIEFNGYGKYFIHSTGHGVGEVVHEYPSISSDSVDFIKESAVVTIEPGIYIKNKFGVRIEDMILVNKDSYENLTQSPKNLIFIN